MYQRLTELDKANSSDSGAAKLELPKFQFNGKTLFCIARNMQALQSILTALEDTRQRLISSYTDTGKVENVPMESRDKLEKEFTAVLQTKVEVKFHTMDIEDVDLDRNPIPAAIQSLLLDYIFVSKEDRA